MATLTELKNKLDLLYPGKVYTLSCEFTNAVSDIRYTELATDADKVAIQAIIDGFDWNAPPPDPDQFAEDVWLDVNLKPVRLQLVSFKDMLKQYLALGPIGQQRIYEAWGQDLKPQFDAVNPAISQLVLQHAVNNHIQLEPPV